MSKSIKFKNNTYIDSSGIVHNRKSLKDMLNNKLNKTVLFDNVPSVGEVGRLSAPGSSYTISGNFSNYDFLLIIFRSRVWGWCKKEELIFNANQFGSSNVATGNLYSAVMPLYNSNTIATMQYYFTNNNKVSVYYNSHYSGDNHLYIATIIGCKLLSS